MYDDDLADRMMCLSSLRDALQFLRESHRNRSCKDFGSESSGDLWCIAPGNDCTRITAGGQPANVSYFGAYRQTYARFADDNLQRAAKIRLYSVKIDRGG